MKLEQNKVRECKLSEECIKEMAEMLIERYCTFSEIQRIANANGLHGGIESILSLFNVRGYLITEITVKRFDSQNKTYVKRTLYKIMTDEDYEKWDEEAHKDAKRRLLAAVSY